MKKQTIIIALSILSVAAKAQTASTSATQRVQCALSDVVGAGMGSGSGGSSTVDIPISGVNALVNGIESPEFQVNLVSTSAFDVTVQSSATNFTYSGPNTTGTTMAVKDVLSVEISTNNTGGSVSNGFTQYQLLDGTTGQKIISSGQAGVRSFGFKYKANPGFNYPAGTYTTSIVYTITKI